MSSNIVRDLKKLAYFVFIMKCLLLPVVLPGNTYYIDASHGNDVENGTSSVTAWRSLDKVNSNSFSPGDSILFKSGEVWGGQLHPGGCGEAGNPIVISNYGEDGLPIFNGGGHTSKTVYLSNQSY